MFARRCDRLNMLPTGRCNVVLVVAIIVNLIDPSFCIPSCNARFGSPSGYECVGLLQGLPHRGPGIARIDRKDHCFTEWELDAHKPASISQSQWRNREYLPLMWANSKARWQIKGPRIRKLIFGNTKLAARLFCYSPINIPHLVQALFFTTGSSIVPPTQR